ncbi:sugar transferase [Chthonobacter rhizosphaerae]|uniref:sugar transferase n=1 Tax=Chthonobacter rhizosphaerae TaxID=2735553 RepID=UPI0031B60114
MLGSAAPWQHGVKRAMDFTLALAALIALAPLLLTVALIIKLSSRGPVFFKQYRVGLGNVEFEIYKFRSMYTDRCDVSGVAQTTENDPRVTPIGRFIRRTSIDELPQLLNVLKGDMSLVGPRPHVAGMLAGGVPYEELVPNYPLRHAMRPGLTGLAQVNGYRGPTTDANKARLRVEHDLEYIRHFSVALDMRIILRTVWTEFLSGSGY